MKIECKLKREGGSLVTLGNEQYHFAPDQLDRHVAEVTDEDHVARFLEIPQYREIQDDGEPRVAATTTGDTLTPTENQDGNSADDARAPADGNLQKGAQGEGDVAHDQGAQKTSSDKHDQGAQEKADEQHDQGAQEKEDGVSGELDIEQARQAYFEAFGKKPHHAMNADTMYERIAKDQA